MKTGVLSIQWHEQQPVYALSFHPAGFLATAGGDKEVNVGPCVAAHSCIWL